MPGYSTVFRNRESIKGGDLDLISSIFAVRDPRSQQAQQSTCWSDVYRSTRIFRNSDLLERLESLLGHLTATWCQKIWLWRQRTRPPVQRKGRESSPEISNRHAQLRSDTYKNSSSNGAPWLQKTYGTFFVNLFSEKVFKLSIWGVSTFVCVQSVFVCKPQLSLEPLISVRFSRFEEYIFYDLT